MSVMISIVGFQTILVGLMSELLVRAYHDSQLDKHISFDASNAEIVEPNNYHFPLLKSNGLLY